MQSYQENDVIFGRDDEIKNLYNRILFDIQTVVYGKSGIGKSSIINAGIIPRAKLDDMLPVDIRLAHTVKKEQKPTLPYTEQIKNKIAEALSSIGGEAEDVTTSRVVDLMTEKSPRSLWELLHRYRLWKVDDGIRKRVTPLLLFDQFEEIFTLETDSKRVEAFFSELADLLNEVKPDYLMSSAAVSDHAQATAKEAESSPKSRNVFTEIASRRRSANAEYLEKSEFHIVITLREDFLSDLERHTTYIPGMKSNRFAILPLNEEQAAKIIMEPVKGLISTDVATAIIQRVTGRTDFKLDGVPEIDVNASLLSLYMEQLYNKKLESNVKTITMAMVEQYGDYFITNFYEESIKGIPDEVVKILEEELITNADKRDNVARIDLVAKGVGEQYIDQLLEKKVLQKFHYNDDERIEFIHDILCPIVNQRILNREQIKEENERREREQEQAQKLKRSRHVIAGVSVVALLALLGFAYAIYKYFTKPTTILDDKYADVILVFNPDKTLEGNQWEADVVIDLLKDTTTMKLLHPLTSNDGRVHIKGPGADTIKIKMLMEKIDEAFKVEVKSQIDWLCQEKEERIQFERPNIDSLRTMTWATTLTRDPKAMFQFGGRVTTLNGAPLTETFVVLGDKLTRTDEQGRFTMTINDSKELMGTTLYLFKNEYTPGNVRGVDILKKLNKDNEFDITMKVRPEYDSLYYQQLDVVKKIAGNEPLTANDSSLVDTYFGNQYRFRHSNVKSPDTTFYYVFKKYSKKEEENEEGRIFGYYRTNKDHKTAVPFDGYLQEIEPDNKTRRWKMTVMEYDSVYNKKRITGIIRKEHIYLSK